MFRTARADRTSTAARSGVRRLVVAATPVVAALVLAAPAMAATQRYASPSGTSSDPCTQASPCSLATAIDSAATGDEVIVEPGSYGSTAAPIATTLDPSSAESVDIHGVAGAPRPVVYSSAAEALDLYDDTATYLDIEDSDADGDGFYASDSTLNEMVVRTSGSGSVACDLGGTETVTDSVCDGAGANAIGIGDDATACDEQIDLQALINTDGYGTGSGSGFDVNPLLPGCELEITVTNSILRGGASGEDIDVHDSAEGQAIVTASHSDYAVTSVGGAGNSLTPAGTATNIESNPQLADPAAENFDETASSPTIDAGITAASDGSYDLNGNPRSEGGLTDIGAVEYTAEPAVSAGSAGSVTETDATLGGTVNPGNETTRYTFNYGPTTAFGASTPTQTLQPGVSTQSVSAPISGLSAGTTYYWELVAANAAGTSTTTTGSFMTVAAPLVAAPAPLLNMLTVTPARFAAAPTGPSIAKVRKPSGTTISYADSETATTTFTVTQARRGVKSGGRCVAPPAHHKTTRLARCTRIVTIGSFTHADLQGANSFHFTGRVGGRALTPGSYTLTAVPENSHYLLGAAASTTFAIKR